MDRFTDTTAGRRGRGPQDVPPSKKRRVNLLVQKWLNGEIDKMEAITTPSGERIVEGYNRDEKKQ